MVNIGWILGVLVNIYLWFTIDNAGTSYIYLAREREIKFICLFENRGHRGPYSPYKPFNHNLYIGIIIFPHIDNPQATGYNLRKTRQIWGIWKLRPAYSLETPNLGQNRWCFVPCDLEIWWMTLENNRASLLCCFKLCATFHSHWWIQTGVTVRKRPIWVKFDDF